MHPDALMAHGRGIGTARHDQAVGAEPPMDLKSWAVPNLIWPPADRVRSLRQHRIPTGCRPGCYPADPTQVVIGSRNVEPRFAMLLDLHRQGDSLPTTAWNLKKTRPTVTWPNQQEAYAVEITAEGHRAFRRLQ